MAWFDSIYSSLLPHRAISVYMYLKHRANKVGQCFPAIKTIARELGYSVSTVKRALDDLEGAGYIIREKRYRPGGGRSSSLYTLK